MKMLRPFMAMAFACMFALTACTSAPASSTNTIKVSSVLSDLLLVNSGVKSLLDNVTGLPQADVDAFNKADANITNILSELEANASGTLTLSTAQGDIETIDTNVNAILALVNNLVATGVIPSSSALTITMASINTLIPVIEQVVNITTTSTADKATFFSPTVARQHLLTVH